MLKPCASGRKPWLLYPLYLMFYTLIKNSGIRMQGASRLPNSTIYVVEAGYLGKSGPLGFPTH